MLSYPEESLQYVPADYDVNKIGFILVGGNTEGSSKFNQKSKPKQPNMAAQQGKHFCHICQRSYMNSSNLRRHNKTLHQSIECKTCNMKFSGEKAESKLKLHKCANESETTQQFDCDTCGHAAPSRESLIWHLELHRKLDIEIDDIFA